MNLLFLSLFDFDTFDERNIYSDLLREFIKHGHTVCCISPVEKRQHRETALLRFGENRILNLKIGNVQKTNPIEKGVSTLQLESLFIRGIKRYFSDITFDLVLYATPPVTFAKVIRYIKKRDGAKSYLMLKDIFPQNSVDLGLLSRSGVKGLLYRYFRRKEKALYALSDTIGCMSPANCEYLLTHNPDIAKDNVELCPNCIEPVDMRVSAEEKAALRRKYGLPLDKKIFVYGGNLGTAQDVPFIVDCLKACSHMEDAHFVIAGSGTGRHHLEAYVQTEKPRHVTLFDFIPKAEYDAMIACGDVGLIFLDHRFTIPNFPSRLLSYMQTGLSVLACTDPHSDVGTVIAEGGFGRWCESNDAAAFAQHVRQTLEEDTSAAGAVGFDYLNQAYSAAIGYRIIIKEELH